MHEETMTDWDSWHVEPPPADFADRVMDAVLAEPRASFAVRRPARSARWIAMVGATAAAAGSLTVLAMIGQSARRGATTVNAARPAPCVEPPSSSRHGEGTDVHAVSAPASRAKYAEGTVVDRKLRDVIRARVVPPIIAQGSERDPHTGLTIPSGASGPSHDLSKDYLQARIREDFFPLARACYETALAKEPRLRGRIVVDFMIVGDAKSGGIVNQAKINEWTDITDAEFTTCMRESMLSMVFAPPENDGWITVSYPFAFSPDDDEGARDD